jgi:predicted transcriptional regulator
MANTPTPRQVPCAREYMTKWHIVLHPEDDVMEAIDKLVSQRASGAAVVNEQGLLVGILTEKDCLRVLSNTAYGGIEGGTVQSYMSTVKRTVSSDTDIFLVAEAFLATNFTVLPVVDGGTLVGRIGRLDMLRAIQKLDEAIESDRAREEVRLRRMQNPRSIEELQHIVGSQRPENVAALFSQRRGEGS